MTSPRFVAALQRVSCWFVLAVAFSIPLAVPVQLRALDFAAFYCAGEVLARHGDPYRVMPLGACERDVSRNGPIAAGAIIPAPLPPYVLGAFELLSRLPFALAQHVFDLLSIAALALSIALLVRTTGRAPPLVAYALAPVAWIVLLMGQALILLLAALSAAAFFLALGRDRSAALCACMMMAEPHLGLPVCLALFLLRPRTRLTLIGVGALILIFSLTIIPLTLTMEYVTAVLPFHALSEARASTQISFTSLLTFLGVSDRVAVVLGGVQYAATTALGIVVARRMNLPSAPVLVPALAALVGGSFLHAYDLLLAIPAGLLFWDKRPLVAALAIIAISPHWVEGGVIGPYLAMVSAVVLLSYAGVSLQRALITVPILGLVLLMNPLPMEHPRLIGSIASTDYAERSWTAWQANTPRSPWWPIKNLGDWAGIIAIFLLATFSSSCGSIDDIKSESPAE